MKRNCRGRERLAKVGAAAAALLAVAGSLDFPHQNEADAVRVNKLFSRKALTQSKTNSMSKQTAKRLGCVCFTIYRGISEIYTTVEFPEFRAKSNEIHVENAVFALRFQTMSDSGLPGLKR